MIKNLIDHLFFKMTLTTKILSLYLAIILLSVIMTAVISYVTFGQLMDNQLSTIEVNTQTIRSTLEELYQEKIELPDLSETPESSSKLLFETIEKKYPEYTVRLPSLEGTYEIRDIPKLIYDKRENKYFFEVNRQIEFSKNLPFQSVVLTIKLNFYMIILKSLLIGTLITTIFLIPVIIILSQRIVKPIISISRGANDIAAGKLGIQIENRSADELGKLTSSFNYMSKELYKIKKIRDDLLATISHELRSPMGRIKGYTEMLVDLSLEAEEQDVYFKSILSEVDYMNNMVGEILEISRLELHKERFLKEDVDLCVLIDGIKRNLEISSTFENVEYKFDYSCGLHYNIDVEKMKRVFMNIIQNSIKAGADLVELSADLKDNCILIKIIDNGAGIANDQLEIVFEKFYRIDKSRTRETGGFGLGLSICKGIIEAHGGAIYFVPRDGGAELHIELPMAAAS
jgi:signal transduction histidine kinase